MNDRPLALRARYVFPGESPPVRDGVLSVQGGKIVALGNSAAGVTPVDLGNVAILPGLVNAHAHLEFSELESPLGRPGTPLTDWIREVVQWRRQRDQDGDGSNSRHADAVRRGLAESLQCGVTAIGEIATSPWSRDSFVQQGASGVIFLELLGLAEEGVEPLVQRAREHVAGFPTVPWPLRGGVSPHATYTVGPGLVDRVATLSAQWRFPVAMHLAETIEELELLQSSCGPFVDLLMELEAWDPTVIPRGIRPLDYLRLLAFADRALVIHGNFLGAGEVEFLAEHRQRMSVVYCPRTHAWFGHGRYSLAEMLAGGVHVALGTDSRASNPDLSILEEMRFAWQNHPDVAPEAILRLGTIDAARALGLDGPLGSLRPGKRADLVVVPLPDEERDDPYELVLDASYGVARVFVGGAEASCATTG